MTTCAARVYHGIDIGGSKMELVSFDADFNPVQRHRTATPQGSYAEFIDTAAALVERADAALDAPARAIGIALPGVRERRTGRYLSANIPALNGQRVAEDFHARLPTLTHVGNDQQCFVFSEANGGAGDGYASVFGAILGTGASGGLCLHGKLVDGRNGLAGEWGHCGLPASAQHRHGLPLLDCGCGLSGCMDRYISGTGLAMLERHLGGSAADAGAVIALAQNGDARARQALAIHCDLLGQCLAGLILLLDPHVIVLGGGLSQYAPLYTELPAAVARHLFTGVEVPPIIPPHFGDAGGARGAALLAHQALTA